MSTEQITGQAPSRDLPLTIGSLFSILRRRFLPCIGVFFITMGGVMLATFLQTPIYEAETTLMITPAQGGPMGLGALSQVPSFLGMSFGSSSLETHRQLLTTPDFLEEATQDLGLDWSLRDLERKINAKIVPNSDMIRLTVADTDPGLAADLANHIVERFIEEKQISARESAREAANFIQEELQDIKKQLFEAEEDVRGFKIREGVIDLAAETKGAFELLAILIGEQSAADATAAEADRLAQDYRRKLNTQDETYVASSTIARNPLVQEMESELAKLELERAGETTVYTTTHEAVQQLDRQIEQARQELENAVKTVVESEVEAAHPLYMEWAMSLAKAEAETRAAQARADALQKTIETERARLDNVPNIQTDLIRLERDKEVTGQIYVMLVEKYHEMQLNEALALSAAEVAAHARKPESPSRPRKLMSLVLGCILGLLLGCLTAGFLETMDNRVSSGDEAKSELGIPILGTVPRISKDHSLLTDEFRDPALEENFHSLRANLHLLRGDDIRQMILVTSPGREDGKSAISVNLGRTFAQGNSRTLIVDGNLRRPSIHVSFSVAAEPGFADALAGMGEVYDYIQPTERENLFVLPVGSALDDPVTLLDSKQVQEIFRTLREGFDIVIVDTPPAGTLADTLVMAPHCDCILLVVSERRTDRRTMREAFEKLQDIGHPPHGIVLNKTRTKQQRYIS